MPETCEYTSDNHPWRSLAPMRAAARWGCAMFFALFAATVPQFAFAQDRNSSDCSLHKQSELRCAVGLRDGRLAGGDVRLRATVELRNWSHGQGVVEVWTSVCGINGTKVFSQRLNLSGVLSLGHFSGPMGLPGTCVEVFVKDCVDRAGLPQACGSVMGGTVNVWVD